MLKKSTFAVILSLLLIILAACGSNADLGSQNQDEQDELEQDIQQDDEQDELEQDTQQDENQSEQQDSRVQAPDFELTTLEGDTVKLSDYRGKNVLLNFWATWCGYCVEEMPVIQQAYEKYGESLEVLAVNWTKTEDNLQEVVDYIQQQGYTFTVPLDEDGMVSAMYGIRGIPATFFIDKDGYVVFAHPGLITEQQLEQYIQSML